MDYTVQINLPDHKLGDQWVGIAAIGPMTVTGFTKGTLTRIKMNFTNGVIVYRCDSTAGADALIVITTPSTWIAHIDPVLNFLPVAGAWNWDMQFTHSNAVSPVTLYKGVLTVIQDVTN